MVELRVYLILVVLIIGRLPESNCALGSEHLKIKMTSSISETPQEITLIKKIISSDSIYIRGFVKSLIGNGVETIGITGIDNFSPEVIFVRGHKFYFVSSEIPKYKLHIHFKDSNSAGSFELGNSRYAVTGSFDRVGAEWELSRIFPMNMD